jgi:hypothetical protein
MSHVTIDGSDFEMDTLTGEAKMQAANIVIIDQEIARLQSQIKIFQLARAACSTALQQACRRNKSPLREHLFDRMCSDTLARPALALSSRSRSVGTPKKL